MSIAIITAIAAGLAVSIGVALWIILDKKKYKKTTAKKL